MRPDTVIVRLGELMLKGRNRRRFEKQALRQLEVLLKPFPSVQTTSEFGRVYLHLNGTPYERILSGLGQIFGLVSYSPAWKVPLDTDAIMQTSVNIMKNVTPVPATFKVSVRRADKKFPYDSLQLANLVGGYVLEHMPALAVDVRQPDTELRVDLRLGNGFLFTSVLEGAGGYPLGTNGKAMLMLSGGIDSPVAGWLALRKGLALEAVHFHSFPYTSLRAQQKVTDLTRRLSLFAGEMKLHMVPLTEIQTRLNRESHENLMITLMKRAMLRITEKLAERNEAMAIVTGDSLGQVASQTLPSLNTIGRSVQMPILRPLIAMDKVEITKLSEKLETYPISILPYEDCCTLFVPKSPSTNPNLQVVERLEAAMEWLEPAINEAVANTQTDWIEWDKVEPEDKYF